MWLALVLAVRSRAGQGAHHPCARSRETCKCHGNASILMEKVVLAQRQVESEILCTFASFRGGREPEPRRPKACACSPARGKLGWPSDHRPHNLFLCGSEGASCEGCRGEVRFGRGDFAQRPKFSQSRVSSGEPMPCVASEFRAIGSRASSRNCVCRQSRPRVAVCLWGVNRCLNRTIASIDSMILGPLRDKDVDLDVFFHSYSLQHISSPWAGESNAPVEGALDEAKRLARRGLVRYEITDQDWFDRHFDYHAFIEKKKFPSTYQPNTVRNLIRSLHSLERVTDLWLLEETRRGRRHLNATTLNDEDVQRGETDGFAFYDKVVYLRPDLLFESPLDVELLFSLKDEQLYTPVWATYGGINDRFAAGSPKAALAFGHRLKHLREFANHQGIHSESFAAFALDRAAVEPVFSKVPCGLRVRHDGHVVTFDCMKVEKRFRNHPAMSRSMFDGRPTTYPATSPPPSNLSTTTMTSSLKK